jgi:hypothetical protein
MLVVPVPVVRTAVLKVRQLLLSQTELVAPYHDELPPALAAATGRRAVIGGPASGYSSFLVLVMIEVQSTLASG